MLAQATINLDGFVTLAFPFVRELVDDIKDEIPAYRRSFDPASKTWRVHPGDAKRAIDLLRYYFGSDVVVNDLRRTARAPRTEQPAGDFATLHLLPTAPRELVRAAYKTLSLLAHPDVTGSDGSLMRALNASYESLRDAGAA